jgi:hypothetical protein
MSGLVVAFMLFDATIHLLARSFVIDAFTKVGYSPSLARPLGLIELICILLYVIPRTSALGAILLTGYLGGAVATNLRTGAPLFSNILFPVYVGVLLWGGIYLRDERVRRLIPLRT